MKTNYTEKDVTHPDTKYTWFTHKDEKPFEVNPPAYSSKNALWLAEMSRVAYVRDQERVDNELKEAGFDTIKHFDSNGTQALIAMNNKVMIVAFRGTEMPDGKDNGFEDLKTDAKFWFKESMVAGRVHTGFKEGLDCIWEEMSDYVVKHRETRSVWFTGHSLGGALATIAAARLGGHGLYVYGCPRVGDKAFTEHLESIIPIYRFQHNNDLVTRVPPAIFYRHAGVMHYITSNYAVKLNASWWHRYVDNFTQTKHILANLLSFKLNMAFSVYDGVKDHSIIHYVKALKSA